MSIILFLLGSGGVTCLAQTSVEDLQNTLRTQAGFDVDDWNELNRTGVVVRLLPAADKREVRVYGLARVNGSLEVIVKALQESMVQQSSKTILSKGRFNDSPSLVDVETLSLEDRDIEDLKHCVVGECELKISAAMLARFKREVNWHSLDYKNQANHLFREMLVDYVQDYQRRGDEALIEYHDQRRPVLVREEQHALVDRLLYVHDMAPEFASYLRRFPHLELQNVESHITWSKLKFGLKPVTIVTHVMTYKPLHSRQILTVSKQIYANHYFDSSLAMTAVISIPSSTGGSDSYLLYTNYSRSDSLTGTFSRVRRGMVETESVENLNELLQRTRANVDLAIANQSSPDGTVRKHMISEWLFQGARVYVWLFALFAIGVWILIGRGSAKRVQGHSSQSGDQS